MKKFFKKSSGNLDEGIPFKIRNNFPSHFQHFFQRYQNRHIIHMRDNYKVKHFGLLMILIIYKFTTTLQGML